MQIYLCNTNKKKDIFLWRKQEDKLYVSNL